MKRTAKISLPSGWLVVRTLGDYKAQVILANGKRNAKLEGKIVDLRKIA
jgi:hypothetical protein